LHRVNNVKGQQLTTLAVIDVIRQVDVNQTSTILHPHPLDDLQ
jgi:hypothetical protein